MDVGSRIRGLRKEQGLSLEALAEKSKVALGTLSRMENGKGGTFRTHQKIAEALGIPIAELYRGLEETEQKAAVAVSAAAAAERFNYDEKASAILLTTQLTDKNMLPQIILLQPGGKTSVEQYKRGTDRWIFCMAGKIEVKLDDQSYTLEEGGALYFKAFLAHQFLNAGRTTAKLISVTSPLAL